MSLMGYHGKQDDHKITFTIAMIIKQGRLKNIKCMNKKDMLHDVPICYIKFLKYNPFWHRIEGIRHI
jgi:hypothetical protein